MVHLLPQYRVPGGALIIIETLRYLVNATTGPCTERATETKPGSVTFSPAES